MQNSLEIRIGRKNIAKRHGCEIIEIKDITSVPNAHIFLEESINNKIQEETKRILRLAMSDRKYQYGEVAVLFSTLDNAVHEEYIGEFNRIVFENSNFKDIIAKRKTRDLILIHNHPNNSTFSGEDIVTLCSNITLLALIAIGNTKSMHVLLKIYSSKNNAVQYINNRAEQLRQQANDKTVENIKKYKDMAALDILKNPDKFGLSYERYNRRHT